MTSIHVDLDSVEWTPGWTYKGPDALYQGQEVFYRKVLSDRRLAMLSKICPLPGKMVKTAAVARSEEHVFNLNGGRVNKSGKPIEAPGNSYTLNRRPRPRLGTPARATQHRRPMPDQLAPAVVKSGRTRRWSGDTERDGNPARGVDQRLAEQRVPALRA
jgi:hypothetical protein